MRDAKLDDVKKLIDAFAEQLLAINDGKAIPLQWKNALLKAIKPAPQKRGRKADVSTIAAVSKELTHARAALAGPDRTIKDKRGEVKKVIADRQNISIRSVERIDKKLWRVFDGSANGKPLDETIRRALIDGVCEAISESITADDKAEQADFNNRRIASINDFGKLIAEKEGAQKSVK